MFVTLILSLVVDFDRMMTHLQDSNQSHMRVKVKKVPPRASSTRGKPTQACPCANRAARIEPLPADNGRSLAQIVISSGMLSIRLSEVTRVKGPFEQVPLCRDASKRKRALRKDRTSLCLSILERLRACAKYRERTSKARVPPRPVTPTSWMRKLLRRLAGKRHQGVLPCCTSPFRIRGGPQRSSSMHSRDVSSARLASAFAPASRARKQGWLVTRTPMSVSGWRSVLSADLSLGVGPSFACGRPRGCGERDCFPASKAFVEYQAKQ